MIEADRLVAALPVAEEETVDRAIRPKRLGDYTGQQAVVEQLEIFIEATRRREDALDHLLIFGPPGWAKRRLRILWRTNLK